MFRNIPPVTKNLLIINVLIWLGCSLFPAFGMTMDRSCGLHYFLSDDFRFWQPITYMFMHANFSHIFFNMFGVLMFGSTIERVFGSARYLLFYMTVGVGAALVQEGVFAATIGHLMSSVPDNVTLSQIASGNVPGQFTHAQIDNMRDIWGMINIPTVGASGALFGVLLAFAMIFPNVPLYLFFIPVPVKAKWMVLGYGLFELVFGITGLQSGVAHFAHLGGMLIAFLLIIYWRKRGEINNDPIY